MRKLLWILGFLVLLSGCGREQPFPVAWIEGEPLTDRELRAALYQSGRFIGPRGIQSREELLPAVEEIVSASLLAKDAYARSMHRGAGFRQVIAQRQETELMRALREQVLSQNPVTEPQIQSHYMRNRDNYLVDTRVRLRHIFFDATRTTTDEETLEVRRRAEAAWEALASGEKDFQQVAAESDLMDASAGEIIGPVFLKRLAPEIQQQIENLRPGEISPPVETSHGYEILKLEEWDEAHYQPLEKVEPVIRSAMERQVVEHVYRLIVEKYRREKPLQVNLDLLADDEAPPDRVVASNEEISVTLGQFRRWKMGVAWGGNEAERGPTDAEILDLMIDGEILRREALRRGLHQDPEVKARVRWFGIRRLADGYVRTQAEALTSEPTEEDLREHYQRYEEAFQSRSESELRIIYVKAHPEDPESIASRGLARREALETIQSLRELALGGEPFEELARLYSEGEEAASGGLLPFSRKGPRGYVIDTTADSLAVGEISEPVEYKEGYILVKKTGEHPSQLLPFDDVRDRVRNHYLLLARREKAEEIRRERFENSEDTRIDEEALDQMLARSGRK